MVRPRAFVTRMVPDEGIARLATLYDVEVNRGDRPLSTQELAERARECTAMVTQWTDRVDGALLDRCPALRIVANVAVGYDNVDVPAASARGVWIANTPGVLTDTTADLAWALIMATARRMGEAERYLRGGKYRIWSMMTLLGADVHGKTLGLAGFGRIGQAVAKRARGFDMRVIYTGARRAAEEVEHAYGAVFVDKPALLREADFLSLHMPLLPETRHWLGENELRLLKPTAHVINTSRGPVVDEAALAKALREGWIAGAGVDVYEREPEVHPALLACENAVLTPHIGSATVETRAKMVAIAAENCLAYLRGERPPTAVNEPR